MTSLRRTLIVLFVMALSAAIFALLMWPVLASGGDYGMTTGANAQCDKCHGYQTAVASISPPTSVPPTAVPTNPPTAVPTQAPTAEPTDPPAPTTEPTDPPAPTSAPTDSPPSTPQL